MPPYSHSYIHNLYSHPSILTLGLAVRFDLKSACALVLALPCCSLEPWVFHGNKPGLTYWRRKGHVEQRWTTPGKSLRDQPACVLPGNWARPSCSPSWASNRPQIPVEPVQRRRTPQLIHRIMSTEFVVLSQQGALLHSKGYWHTFIHPFVHSTSSCSVLPIGSLWWAQRQVSLALEPLGAKDVAHASPHPRPNRHWHIRSNQKLCLVNT